MTAMRRLTAHQSILFDVAVSFGVLLLAAMFVGWWEVAALGAGMAVALLWRRRYPLSVMAAVAVLGLVQVIITTQPYGDPLPFDVAVLIAMYSVVKYGHRIRDAVLAATVVAVGIGIEVVRHATAGWWAQAMFYTAVCGGAWMAGYVVRTRRAYVAGLEERAATLAREQKQLAQIAVAQERATIAREMHDVVAHSLGVIIAQADGGRYAMVADPEQGRAVLATVATTARDALDEMRRLVGLLRGEADRDADDEAERQLPGVGRLQALVARARAAGLDVTLHTGHLPVADNSTVSVAIYRLVQEALTNVLHHAGPDATCVVTVDNRDGLLHVTVIDDGGGARTLKSTPDPHRDGHGLVGMRERTTVLGGTLSVGPRSEGGWAVHATLPAPAERGAVAAVTR